MPSFITFLIYAALAAAAVALLAAINHAIGEHYIEPVRVEYEAKLATCEQNTADAVKANAVVRTTLATTIQAYKDAEAEMTGRTKDAAARAAAAIAKAQADAKAALVKADRDRLVAAGPPTPGDFTTQCKAADATLTDLARDRP